MIHYKNNTVQNYSYLSYKKKRNSRLYLKCLLFYSLICIRNSIYTMCYINYRYLHRCTCKYALFLVKSLTNDTLICFLVHKQCKLRYAGKVWMVNTKHKYKTKTNSIRNRFLARGDQLENIINTKKQDGWPLVINISGII